MSRQRTKNRNLKTINLDVKLIDWVEKQPRGFNFSDFINNLMHANIQLIKPEEVELSELQDEITTKVKRMEAIRIIQGEKEEEKQKTLVAETEKTAVDAVYTEIKRFMAESDENRELANKVLLELYPTYEERTETPNDVKYVAWLDALRKAPRGITT